MARISGATSRRPPARRVVSRFRVVRDEHLGRLAAPESRLTEPLAVVERALLDAFTSAVRRQEPGRGRLYADLMDLQGFVEDADAAIVERLADVSHETANLEPILDRIAAARARVARTLEEEDPGLEHLDIYRIDLRPTAAETMEAAPRAVIGSFNPATVWPDNARHREGRGQGESLLAMMASGAYILTMWAVWDRAVDRDSLPIDDFFLGFLGWLAFYVLVGFLLVLTPERYLDALGRWPSWAQRLLLLGWLTVPGFLWAGVVLGFARFLAGS